jgi:hypothetical protein
VESAAGFGDDTKFCAALMTTAVYSNNLPLSDSRDGGIPHRLRTAYTQALVVNTRTRIAKYPLMIRIPHSKSRDDIPAIVVILVSRAQFAARVVPYSCHASQRVTS